MPILPFKNIEDVIQHINARDKPLAVYYFGNTSGKNCELVKS